LLISWLIFLVSCDFSSWFSLSCWFLGWFFLFLAISRSILIRDYLIFFLVFSLSDFLLRGIWPVIFWMCWLRSFVPLPLIHIQFKCAANYLFLLLVMLLNSCILVWVCWLSVVRWSDLFVISLLTSFNLSTRVLILLLWCDVQCLCNCFGWLAFGRVGCPRWEFGCCLSVWVLAWFTLDACYQWRLLIARWADFGWEWNRVGLILVVSHDLPGRRFTCFPCDPSRVQERSVRLSCVPMFDVSYLG